MSDLACDKAPIGWRCTRRRGHDGPCAAEPEHPLDPPPERPATPTERLAELALTIARSGASTDAMVALEDLFKRAIAGRTCPDCDGTGDLQGWGASGVGGQAACSTCDGTGAPPLAPDDPLGVLEAEARRAGHPIRLRRAPQPDGPVRPVGIFMVDEQLTPDRQIDLRVTTPTGDGGAVVQHHLITSEELRVFGRSRMIRRRASLAVDQLLEHVLEGRR